MMIVMVAAVRGDHRHVITNDFAHIKVARYAWRWTHGGKRIMRHGEHGLECRYEEAPSVSQAYSHP